jgi:hypothetical protein
MELYLHDSTRHYDLVRVTVATTSDVINFIFLNVRRRPPNGFFL